VNANHVAASPPVLSSALSKFVKFNHATQVNTKSEPTILMPAVLLHAVPLFHHQSAQSVHQLTSQLVNVMKTSRAKLSMPTAAATSTTANATRTSASISVKKPAHQVTHELLSTLAPVAQLLDVAPSRLFQPQPQQQLHQEQRPSLILQSPISLQSHQPPSALMLKVVNEFTVKAGLLNLNHALFTLAVPSTTSEPPSVNAVTNESNAPLMNARSPMSLMNAAPSTHAKNNNARTLSVQTLFQLANTMRT